MSAVRVNDLSRLQIAMIMIKEWTQFPFQCEPVFESNQATVFFNQTGLACWSRRGDWIKPVIDGGWRRNARFMNNASRPQLLRSLAVSVMGCQHLVMIPTRWLAIYDNIALTKSASKWSHFRGNWIYTSLPTNLTANISQPSKLQRKILAHR